MGNYKKYSLKINPEIKKREDVLTFLRFFYREKTYMFPFHFSYNKNIIDSFLLGKSNLTLSNFNEGQGIKWENNENDMRELSKYLPGYIFTLKIVDEETENIWIKYFKDGKMQASKARIEFDPYDENKLK
ncbi:MAG: hypothetical protein ACOCRX_07470 [Candidatus Woesearchaeota archaeon]